MHKEDISEGVANAEKVVDLKNRRDFEYTRKMIRKSSEWKAKHGLKEPMPFSRWYKNWCDADVRNVRSHMTMHVRGGWQVRLEDDGVAEVEETDWVAEVEEKPARKEVALIDIARPAKPRRRHQRGMYCSHCGDALRMLTSMISGRLRDRTRLEVGDCAT